MGCCFAVFGFFSCISALFVLMGCCFAVFGFFSCISALFVLMRCCFAGFSFFICIFDRALSPLSVAIVVVRGGAPLGGVVVRGALFVSAVFVDERENARRTLRIAAVRNQALGSLFAGRLGQAVASTENSKNQ